MSNNVFSKFLMCCTWLLNIDVWQQHIHLAIKIGYTVIVGLITLLSGINQWNIFKKTYHTWKVVVIIDHVFTYLTPKTRKKNRHHPSTKNKYP